MALNGLFPGLVTTRSVANLGTFEIEVIIEPIRPSGGGGYVPGDRKDKYKVTIRISMKSGKTWKLERIVSNTLARVVARLMKIKLEVEETPQIVVHSVTATTESKPDIKVHVK